MKLENLTRRLIQLRKVANHIDRHIQSHPAGSLTLDDLADVAHLSRFHFERVFAGYAGETPLVRVRRLRLARARRLIEAGGAPSLLELALNSGYASPEAFSRAFRAQFGCAPSALPRRPAPITQNIRIAMLPALGIQYIPYEGTQENAMQVFDELRARAMLQNIPRERRKGWRVDLSNAASDGTVSLQAALLSERLGTHIAGLRHDVLPEGHYAVVELQGGYEMPALPALAQRVVAETGWTVSGGAILQSFHNATYLPAQQEKRCDLYLPVQR